MFPVLKTYWTVTLKVLPSTFNRPFLRAKILHGQEVADIMLIVLTIQVHRDTESLAENNDSGGIKGAGNHPRTLYIHNL